MPQRRRVVLRYMIGVKAQPVILFHQLQTAFIERSQGDWTAIHVIENTEVN